MEFLKNIPEETSAYLANLIEIRPGRVVSMTISQSDACQMTMLALDAGESISQEQYPGDALYYVLEGEMPLQIGEQALSLKTGSCLAVPAQVPHAVGGGGPCKLLQIILRK